MNSIEIYNIQVIKNLIRNYVCQLEAIKFININKELMYYKETTDIFNNRIKYINPILYSINMLNGNQVKNRTLQPYTSIIRHNYLYNNKICKFCKKKYKNKEYYWFEHSKRCKVLKRFIKNNNEYIKILYEN